MLQSTLLPTLFFFYFAILARPRTSAFRESIAGSSYGKHGCAFGNWREGEDMLLTARG
jgi:hypothetical protein